MQWRSSRKSTPRPTCDHATAAGGDGHGAGPPEDLQLNRGALHAGDPQRHPPVVDLVIGELLQQRIGDLNKSTFIRRQSAYF